MSTNETTTQAQPTSIPDEISAMRKIATTLDRLDPATRDRVARWTAERYLPDTDQPEA